MYVNYIFSFRFASGFQTLSIFRDELVTCFNMHAAISQLVPASRESINYPLSPIIYLFRFYVSPAPDRNFMYHQLNVYRTWTEMWPVFETKPPFSSIPIKNIGALLAVLRFSLVSFCMSIQYTVAYFLLFCWGCFLISILLDFF